MYKIKEAAQRAGVTVPLLRAWERRYGIVRPARTASGYRLYDEPAIERLRAMRGLVDSGWSPSQAAREIETSGIPEAPAAELADDSAGAASSAGDVDLVTAFVDGAAVLDEQRLDAVLDDLFAAGSFERVVDDLLMPALRALGRAWAEGTVSVGAEHAASHAVLRRLSASFEAAARASGDRPVLVGLPPGSRHEIGALAFATAARRRGMAAVYLGADVPRESWPEAVRRTGARAVVLAVPTPSDRAAVTDVIQALAGADVLVAIGGPCAAEVSVPDSVLRLLDGIGPAARSLEDALARRG